MHKKINDFMNDFSSELDIGMSKDIQAFLKGEKSITSYQLTLDDNKNILIKIELKNYSNILEKDVWNKFIKFVGYEYLNIYIKESFCDANKYSYITADSSMKGVKIEVIISH